MKITVIGGGSTYTPELIGGFIDRAEQLQLSELWLLDIDEPRLQIVGGFAKRMVAARGDKFRVVLSTNREAALEGASYVLTQLRVGHMAARREDEYLGRRHGLIGQETTGVGGMAKALRTIPVILGIAQQMRQLAPDALLVNFTNPAGLITQALARYAPDVSAVGVCNVPITAKMMILQLLRERGGRQIAPQEAQLITLGLNHLSWHYGFQVNGQDIWDEVLALYLEQLREGEEPEWEPRLIETLRVIPNYYLQYYYHTAHKLQEQEKWPPSRAEEVMKIEKELLDLYADPALDAPPETLKQRGGAYYSTMATQLITAHANDLDEIHVVNRPNGGTIPAWPADWVLELPCRVRRESITPLPAKPLPPELFGLLAAVKSYELLTADAAVHGDRETAYKALLVHPLGPSSEHIEAVLEDMLETHRAYLPQFFPEER